VPELISIVAVAMGDVAIMQDVQANWRTMMASGNLVVFVTPDIMRRAGMPGPMDNSMEYVSLTAETVMAMALRTGDSVISLESLLDRALARAANNTTWSGSAWCGRSRSSLCVSLALRYAHELPGMLPAGADFGVIVWSRQRVHSSSSSSSSTA
jgi:hypothetical protein